MCVTGCIISYRCFLRGFTSICSLTRENRREISHFLYPPSIKVSLWGCCCNVQFIKMHFHQWDLLLFFSHNIYWFSFEKQDSWKTGRRGLQKSKKWRGEKLGWRKQQRTVIFFFFLRNRKEACLLATYQVIVVWNDYFKKMRTVVFIKMS